LGVRELAAKAKVAPATLSRFEAGEPLKPRTVDAIQKALEDAGIIVIQDDDYIGIKIPSTDSEADVSIEVLEWKGQVKPKGERS
jgi:transcriptional regulator with XRE-family HTH domain